MTAILGAWLCWALAAVSGSSRKLIPNGIQEVGQSAKSSRRIEGLLRLSQSGPHDMLGLAAPVERGSYCYALTGDFGSPDRIGRPVCAARL